MGRRKATAPPRTCKACARQLTIRKDGTWICPSALCVNAGIVQAKSTGK